VDAGFSSSEFALILNVVVDQGHIVEDLDGCRSRKSVSSLTSDRFAEEKCQSRPESFSAAIKKLPHRLEESNRSASPWKVFLDLPIHHRPVLLKHGIQFAHGPWMPRSKYDARAHMCLLGFVSSSRQGAPHLPGMD